MEISFFVVLISVWSETDRQTCRSITVIVKEKMVIEYNQIFSSYVGRRQETKEREREREKTYSSE